MELLPILIVAILAMAALAALRVVRVLRFRRTPLPDRGRGLFLLGFVLVPPIALWGLTAVPVYIGVLAGLVVVMWVAASVLDRFTVSRTSQIVRLALVGSEGDPIDRGATPLTARLSESIGLVTRANSVFPRGIQFPRQVDRSGFRDDWDALDSATRTLESRIADDHHRGLGVSATAASLADDARSRLNTLRRIAGDHGQAWAVGAA